MQQMGPMHRCSLSAPPCMAAAGQGRAGSGFHWTELYLGVLLTLLAVAALAALLWERRQRSVRRDRARTAENVRFNADATWLKHLLGEARPSPITFSSECWKAPACAALACMSAYAMPLSGSHRVVLRSAAVCMHRGRTGGGMQRGGGL